MVNLRIREMRENSDLNQKTLAAYLKITQQTYSRYETGELRPSIYIMDSLADFYNTTVDYLIGRTNKM